jgi:hypothetical protein
MSVFKNGRFYHFEFVLDGRRRRGSTGTANKPLAIAEERFQRERLKKSYSQILEEENREQRRKRSNKRPRIPCRLPTETPIRNFRGLRPRACE